MKPTPEASAEATASDLRVRALRLLARREHSRAELSRKLEAAGFARAETGLLLDDFESKNWLSDLRFAESYVADHRARAGSIKLAYDLRQRGVADSTIESVLNDNRDSELDRAREIWRKKFNALPNNAAEKAKQIRFMQSRGFTGEVIRRAIGNMADE